MRTRDLHLIGWGGVFLMLAACAIWAPFSRLTFVGADAFLSLGVGVAVAWLVVARIAGRLRSDRSPLGSGLHQVADRTALVLRALFFMFILLSATLVFSYLSAVANFPLRDTTFAAVDRAFGLDWVGLLALLNGRPWLSRTLTLVYWSGGLQLWFVLLVLGATGQRARLAETEALFSLSTITVCVLGLFFPAVGAMAYYQPPAEYLTNFLKFSGMWHYEAFMSLRTAAEPRLDFSAFAGVIQFPSFHTVLAVLTTYAVRDWKWLFWPALATNSLVVLATLPEGGHHMSDSIAGGLISIVAILFVRARYRLLPSQEVAA
jgi:membrane-associated phospholipid phosphatase